MARSITAGMITEITGPIIYPIFLVKLEFPSGDVNVWSGLGDKLFNGDTYAGVGGLGGISTVQETQLLKATDLTLTLSGIPSANISLALDEDYSERPVNMWFGALDANDAIISDPILIFTGRMDIMSIREGPETSGVSLKCENRLVDLERMKLRTYTPEDQKEEFPADEGLDFVTSLFDGKKVIWASGT